MVAEHQRIWAKHQLSLIHNIWLLPGSWAAAGSRCSSRCPTPTWKLRSLSDYDTALGISADLDGVAA